MEEKICPHVKEPCIGPRCSEFVPRHNFIGHYNCGVQDLAVIVWCWLRRTKYKEPTYTGTSCAHCNIRIRSAERWDKDEFKDTRIDYR